MAVPRSSDGIVQPFQLESLGLRGRLVRLGGVAQSVIGAHDYPDPIARLLGETLALCAGLAAALKFDGIFTLQTKGNGPVSMVVTDVTSDGEMRGYAEFDEARLAAVAAAAPNGKGVGTGATGQASIPRLLGAGHLAFTVDQGPDTDSYQGIVELGGATLAECAHQYFRKSEQIDTGIRLAAGRLPDGGDGAWRAAAMMLQRMPPLAEDDGAGAGAGASWDATWDAAGDATWDERAEEGWRRALTLLGSVSDGELLDANLKPNDLLYRLFHEEGVRVFRRRTLIHRCRCSRERVQNMLAAMPQAEVEGLKIDGEVVVTCQFCNARYDFDEAALAALYAG